MNPDGVISDRVHVSHPSAALGVESCTCFLTSWLYRKRVALEGDEAHWRHLHFVYKKWLESSHLSRLTRTWATITHFMSAGRHGCASALRENFSQQKARDLAWMGPGSSTLLKEVAFSQANVVSQVI